MLKKLALALGCGGCLMAPAQADTIFGVYAGAQYWNAGTDGGFANNSSLTNFDFDDEGENAFYIAVEHPIPFVPNVKLSNVNMVSNGLTTLTSTFDFGGTEFTANTDVIANMDVQSTDIILYYELFDNDLISFDLGLNGKYLDGTLDVRDQGNTLSGVQDFSAVIPMLYSKLEVGVPLTGWNAYVEGSFLAIDDHSLIDYQAAITYSVIDNLAVDVELQLGYRSVELDVEDIDDIYADLQIDGFFAGVEVHF